MTGLFGGMALQKLIVELPARKVTGAVLFAKYARAADLGNGVYVYPAFAVMSELITIAAFVIAITTDDSAEVIAWLGIASCCGLGVLVMTFFAAPQMLRIGKAEDREEIITPLLEKFVRYSWPRAVFVWLQFGALLWVLRSRP